MKTIVKKQLLNRMSYLKGHLDGVRRMIEKDVYCIEVINQNLAIRAALDKVNELILKNHLDTCVTTAIKNNNEKTRRRVIKEILAIFKTKSN